MVRSMEKLLKEKLATLEEQREHSDRQQQAINTLPWTLHDTTETDNELIRPGTLDLEASYELIGSLKEQIKRRKLRYLSLQRDKQKAEAEASFLRKEVRDTEAKMVSMTNEQKVALSEESRELKAMEQRITMLSNRVQALEADNAKIGLLVPATRVPGGERN